MKNTTSARMSSVPENQECDLSRAVTTLIAHKPLCHRSSSVSRLPGAYHTSQKLFQDADHMQCHLSHALKCWPLESAVNKPTCCLHPSATTRTPSRVPPSRETLQAHLICQLVQLLRHDIIWKCERSQIILSWGDKSSTVTTSPDSWRSK